ncbi:MAG: hypothetical protein GKB98_02855 [Methanobacteriales archaeon]|nr:hypothetical protein [Methanobacteriales archaeon]
MNQYLKVVLYGFLVWLLPFVVSLFIYPLKVAGSPLFESIMPLVISLTVVVLAFFYLKNLDGDYIKEGVIIGVFWFTISIIIDLLLFLSPSALQMSFTDYLMDIGITYLLIPFITIGMGLVAAKAKK